VAVETSLANGGMINEHHGVGLKLSRFMQAQYGSAWPLLESLKRAIDPNGIMNPGKVGFGTTPYVPGAAIGAHASRS
jgi:alkyldihydroxyacetonephosphate synthase